MFVISNDQLIGLILKSFVDFYLRDFFYELYVRTD